MNLHGIYTATVAHYLAPIKEYLEDTSVSEIMINHANEIYVERDGQLHKTPAIFNDEEAYEAAVNNILQFTGKSLTDDNPLVDSRLPDGSRVHVAKTPCARFGTVMTIRKFNRNVLDMDWIMHLGTVTDQAAEYLKVAIRSERNLLVAGGTSSGKTSLLNALSAYIPEQERVVVIEDSAELQIQRPHVLSLESRQADRYGRGYVGIRELFKSSLRLRPDRIIIGEVRGGEALDMIQAMTSGHGGSMGTIHADSTFDTLNRLETLALMSKIELPLHALRAQISSAIDVVVQMSRQLGGKRVITQISEIDPLGEDSQYRIRDIFLLKPVGDAKRTLQLTWTGQRSSEAGHLRPEDQECVTEATAGIFGNSANASHA